MARTKQQARKNMQSTPLLQSRPKKTKQQALKTRLGNKGAAKVLARDKQSAKVAANAAKRKALGLSASGSGSDLHSPPRKKATRTKKNVCPVGQKYNRAPTVKACVRLDSKGGMGLGSAGQVQSGKAQAVFADVAKHKYSGSVAKGTALYIHVAKGDTREQMKLLAAAQRVDVKLRAVCPSKVNLGNNSLTDPKERAKQSRQRRLQREAVKRGLCPSTYDGLTSDQITVKTHKTKKGKTVATFEPSLAAMCGRARPVFKGLDGKQKSHADLSPQEKRLLRAFDTTQKRGIYEGVCRLYVNPRTGDETPYTKTDITLKKGRYGHASRERKSAVSLFFAEKGLSPNADSHSQFAALPEAQRAKYQTAADKFNASVAKKHPKKETIRRNKSAYQCFCAEHRQTPSVAKLPFGQQGKACSAAWKKVTDRAQYVSQADTEFDQYNAALRKAGKTPDPNKLRPSARLAQQEGSTEKKAFLANQGNRQRIRKAMDMGLKGPRLAKWNGLSAAEREKVLLRKLRAEWNKSHPSAKKKTTASPRGNLSLPVAQAAFVEESESSSSSDSDSDSDEDEAPPPVQVSSGKGSTKATAYSSAAAAKKDGHQKGARVWHKSGKAFRQILKGGGGDNYYY
jgi:hypothetical protein